MSAPVVEWRSNLTPFTPISAISPLGSGFNGAIPVGTTSAAVPLRIYNNFLGVAGVADAITCVIACYDDVVHQGTAVNPETLGQYVQVSITDYNGQTAGADTQFFGIGGSVKHPMPMNGGTLSGTGANYISVSVQVVVPTTASQGGVSQGVWIEYNSTS